METMFVQNFGERNKTYYGVFESGLVKICSYAFNRMCIKLLRSFQFFSATKAVIFSSLSRFRFTLILEGLSVRS